ncbi:MAG: hypothetical protein AB7O62_20575 [Pirellulales bacterium]
MTTTFQPTSTEPRLSVAVYAIARDEERHVERFMSGAKEADVVVVGDTGSTDGTIAALCSAKAVVHSISISPWRFDDARNAALSLVPAAVEVCVSLDLDEVLLPGWRAALQRAWTGEATRLRYRFVSSWIGKDEPGTVFLNDRIHARHGYRWKLPVHEVVEWTGEGPEKVAMCPGLEVQHFPDESKSRGGYLPLLERAANEAPDDPRVAHYLGREYWFHGRYSNSIRELQRSLDLPRAKWTAQRGEACRLIARCHASLGLEAERVAWLWKAVGEISTQRETWVDLAEALYQNGDFSGAYFASLRSLAINEPSPDYFNEGRAWGALPHDLLSISAWKLGLPDLAAEQAEIAANLAPHDERIQNNARFFRDRNSLAAAHTTA